MYWPLIGGTLTWWLSEPTLDRDLGPPSLRVLHSDTLQLKEQLDQRLSEYCHRSLLQFVDLTSSEAQPSGPQLPLELVQLHVIARHGDRSPAHKFEMGSIENFSCGLEGKSWEGLRRFAVKSLPADAHINLADFPVFPGPPNTHCGVGMLTDVGFRQQRTLGALTRKGYHAFLSTVKPDQIFVHSTSFKRTVQSAAAFLHGYLRDDEAGIPIHISEGDLLSSPPVGVKTHPPCTNLGVFNQETHTEAPGINRWKALVESVLITFDLSFGPYDGEATIKLADHLMARLCHQIPLPCNADGHCLNVSTALELIRAADVAWGHRYSHDFSLVAARPFLKHSLEVMDSLVHSKHTYRFMLSFAHDSTISVVLDALGAKPSNWMPYASRLAVELWKSKDDSLYYVRVIFNGRDLTDQIAKVMHSTKYPGLIEYGKWRTALLAERSLALYQKCVNMTRP